MIKLDKNGGSHLRVKSFWHLSIFETHQWANVGWHPTIAGETIENNDKTWNTKFRDGMTTHQENNLSNQQTTS